MCVLALASLAGCSLLFTNRAPVARFNAPYYDGYVPLRVRLDARESYDPDGSIEAYRWTFGDGGTAVGAVAIYTFDTPGQHTVQLEIVDNDGATATRMVSFVALEPPEGYLARRFSWTFQGQEQLWDLLIPEALHVEYATRESSFSDRYRYELYVEDGLDEYTLEGYARELLSRANGDHVTFLQLALAFVQGAIEYEPDPPGFEQPRYPLETLVDGKGDCEDTAILYVDLINTVGAGASLIFVDTDGDRTPDHLAALVPVPMLYSGQVVCGGGTLENLMVFGGELLAYAETSVDVGISAYIPLGCDPWSLSEADVIERWTFDGT
jgi:transglutaminase-like putative cysteine protease